MRFEWDFQKAIANLHKHKVSFEEAIEAFFDSTALDEFDEEHSQEETRHTLIGMSSKRLLFVVYTEPTEGIVRIISARKAEAKYRKYYEEQF